ncbi:MAG TPA: aminoglycoside phosphotransferase family protein [Caulobacteraceae bacterium]|jgi:aminoglycoside phosphotransferase (APT) family kinase protein|nr:aminoglycoside phosphotransferase family protein [Caulobacteraceae bacterium]
MADFDGLKQGEVDLGRLVARIGAEFPSLDLGQPRLNDHGADHAVVILGDAWVFRFPRGPEAAACAAGERRLLAHLNRAAALATPRYERVAAAGDFAGYRMIVGDQLSPVLFARLPHQTQEGVLEALGGFLAVLHATPPALAASSEGATPPPRTAAQTVRRYHRRRERLAAALPGDLGRRIDVFYEALPAALDDAPTVLVHGDLTEDHILLAPEVDRLAGLIDFTDAGPADPAFDFTFLWAYGDWAPAHAARRYGTGEAVDRLLRRSRWWFIRYGVDQLWWNLSGARGYDVTRVLAHIRAGLDALGF